MKNNFSLTLLLGLNISFNLFAQQVNWTAENSDPNKMRWMNGFPPKEDSILSAADGSFFKFPALRYSVCHMREFMPTTRVIATNNNHYIFKTALDKNISNLRFTPWDTNKTMTWEESLSQNFVDGVIVLHKGVIVYENYFGALNPEGIHAVMSVSKTFTGTLGATLVAEGKIDETKTVSQYIPELKNSAFADATVRQVLDMTTALQYSEDYSDPKAEIWAFSSAGDFLPKPKGYVGPENYYDYLATVKKKGNHGESFAYKTINTDVMAWIISRVTGKNIPTLLSERIWQPMGANYDGYFQLGAQGIPFAGGGFNANLRDLAMFGEMIRNNGLFNGKQIIPQSVVQEIMKGGNQELFKKAGYTQLKNWSYTNMWWITHNQDNAFMARGVHGQAIYIDPKAEMVIVRLASHPIAGNGANDPYSLPAYQAIADYLMSK